MVSALQQFGIIMAIGKRRRWDGNLPFPRSVVEGSYADEAAAWALMPALRFSLSKSAYA
jgi:hypothetical protein